MPQRWGGGGGQWEQGLLKHKLLGLFSPGPVTFLTSYQVGPVLLNGLGTTLWEHSSRGTMWTLGAGDGQGGLACCGMELQRVGHD